MKITQVDVLEADLSGRDGMASWRVVLGAIDMIQPDVCLVGGISEAYRAAHFAHAYDVGVQAHICVSPLATAIGLQFEAANPTSSFTSTIRTPTGVRAGSCSRRSCSQTAAVSSCPLILASA
jgi:hypothetical protein